MQKILRNLGTNLHRNLNNPDSKCNWVMDSLAKGWLGDEHHFWGFIGDNQKQITQLTEQGKDWYFWDMPYWGRWNGLKEALNPTQDFYWRVSRNSVHYRKTVDYPGDRFARWNIKPHEYRTGTKILVCPSSETMTRYITGMSVDMWLTMIIGSLKKLTDRPVEVRHKPRNAKTSGPAAAIIPFADQAQDTHCVVTSISLCAMEAQLLGIPTICHPSSFAADISSTKLEDIETPFKTDISQWLYNLAYSQFTHAEIESGLAQEILNA